MFPSAESQLQAPALRPNGAAAAYGAVIRGTETPRDIEYRVLARVCGLLQDARLPSAGPAVLPEAIHETRVVWTAFLADLASPGNQWDDQGKARLISLARWVLNEADRVLRDRLSLDALIDVNQAVMRGLQPRTQPALDAA